MPVRSLAGKTTTLSLALDTFLPHARSTKLDRLDDQEKKLTDKHLFDLADALWSKPKVTIVSLGQIDGPGLAQSAIINFMQVAEAPDQHQEYGGGK